MSSDETNPKNAYLKALFTRNYSPLTIQQYGDIVSSFESFARQEGRPLELATKRDARGFLISLVDRGFNPITINQRLIILRSFFNWVIENEYRQARNPFLGIERQDKGTKLLPVFCVDEEIRRLYNLIDDDHSITVQEVTMFDCFFSTGIRTSELCNLTTDDISHFKETVFLKIRGGKGGKDREVHVQPFGWEAIQKHLAGIKQRGYTTNWIFPNASGGKMIRQSVYKSIRKILSKVKDRRLGAHTLRHTFATYLLRNNTPIKGIQIQMGHSNLSTTQVYTHVDADRLKGVHKHAHPRG